MQHASVFYHVAPPQWVLSNHRKHMCGFVCQILGLLRKLLDDEEPHQTRKRYIVSAPDQRKWTKGLSWCECVFVSVSPLGRRGGSVGWPCDGLLDRHRQLRHAHVRVATAHHRLSTAGQHYRCHRHDHTGCLPHFQAAVRLQLEPSSRLLGGFSSVFKLTLLPL